jgi:hypothetical protein
VPLTVTTDRGQRGAAGRFAAARTVTVPAPVKVLEPVIVAVPNRVTVPADGRRDRERVTRRHRDRLARHGPNQTRIGVPAESHSSTPVNEQAGMLVTVSVLLFVFGSTTQRSTSPCPYRTRQPCSRRRS